ncbi:MAG: energy transducer TonB, partial [Gammaproteobacteria bacterium]
MQFINHRENALKPGKGRLLSRLGCPVNSLMDHVSGEENPVRLFSELFLLVMLLHAYVIVYLLKPSEVETLAKPLIMDVALIAAPAPPAAKPVPPSPPKPRPTPVKAKKATVMPKQVQAVQKPVSTPISTPEPAPAAKPAAETTTAPALTPSTPSPVAAQTANSLPKADTFTEANYRANYKFNPKPEYPRLAKSRGWQGKVLLRVQVSADGRSA